MSLLLHLLAQVFVIAPLSLLGNSVTDREHGLMYTLFALTNSSLLIVCNYTAMQLKCCLSVLSSVSKGLFPVWECQRIETMMIMMKHQYNYYLSDDVR